MTTDPVTGSCFLEREEILGLLAKRLNAFKQGYRQNMALVGNHGVGKSSILHQFLAQNTDSSILSVFVEVPHGSLELFVKRMMSGILMGLLKSKGQDVPWDVAELIQAAKQYVPKSVRHMRGSLKLVNQGRHEEAYREALALPRILREELGTKAILILDHFSDLETLPIRDPFGTFGKEIMVDKDTLYLVSSSRPLKARSIFREKLNLLFGNFEIFDIKNFDFASASHFIRKKLEGHEVGVTEEKFLIQITDAHPYYLSALLERVRDLLVKNQSKDLTRLLIFQAFVDEILNVSGKIHRHFDHLYSIPIRSKSYLSSIQVLAGIALGHRKISRLAKYVARKQSDVKKVLQKLLDEEVIQKEGSLHLIPDTLLRIWLKHVVTVGVLGFETEAERRRDYFIHQLEIEFKRVEEEEAKELPKRVEDLFRQFSGEVISLGAFKVLCPVFQDVISKPTNGRVFPVLARAAQGTWMCQVAYQPVKEEDIRLFVKDAETEHAKVKRKILVALSGIDLNATLLAKNAKISIWDLKNLNRLLDIYDRPKVIL